MLLCTWNKSSLSLNEKPKNYVGSVWTCLSVAVSQLCEMFVIPAFFPLAQARHPGPLALACVGEGLGKFSVVKDWNIGVPVTDERNLITCAETSAFWWQHLAFISRRLRKHNSTRSPGTEDIFKLKGLLIKKFISLSFLDHITTMA